MSPAATAATAVPREETARRPRRTKPPVERRAAIQLLLGVLIVGAIPIASTVRILEANALRNERTHADSALRAQLQSGLRDLNRLGDDASAKAADLANAEDVQRAFLAKRPSELAAIAAKQHGIRFYLGGKRLGPAVKPSELQRAIWLTADSRRVGQVIASAPLDHRVARRLSQNAPHAQGDRLLLARRGRLLGLGAPIAIHGQTVTLGKTRYRFVAAGVPDAHSVRLLALRPESMIEHSVAPYRQRVRYAAIGSFALLVLMAFLFAGPILRILGDFRRVASQATTDGLTGLGNRRTFDEELALEWRRAHRIGDSFALVLLDLDDFKKVNDKHGHPAGDAVLRTVGELLGNGVRQIDLAARYGGEEFVVLVPESDLKGAVQLAKRLKTALSKARVELPDGRTLKVTASFGVAAKGELASAEELIVAADEALYEAKRAGKNRVVAAEPKDEAEAPKPKARATITDDAGLGKGGLRTARGSGARGGGERRTAKGRPNRPKPKDPA
jgi:diguanylate cyclase (GGDEF)-like protein